MYSHPTALGAPDGFVSKIKKYIIDLQIINKYVNVVNVISSASRAVSTTVIFM